MSEELSEREPPVVRCPNCGGDPTPESVAESNLSSMGYLHDDEAYDCADCGTTWVHGVPIGDNETDLADELTCDVCGDGEMRVHRIEFADDEHGVRALRLHLKCPDCYYFRSWERDVEAGQRTVLVGHPSTTGSISDAQTDNTLLGDNLNHA